jgi:hypothetical protein
LPVRWEYVLPWAVSGCRRTTREGQRFADQRGEARGHYLTEGVKDAIWVLRAEGSAVLRSSAAGDVEADGE